MKKLQAVLIFMLLLPVAAWGTVTGQSLSVSFICSGSTGPYPFTFPISDVTALTVIQAGSALAASAYTVSPVNGNYANGGSVTLTTACSTGTLILQRITPLTQQSVFTDNMPVPMKTFERALDKLTEIAQERSGITWVGPWSVTTIYTNNQGVNYNGSSYVSTVYGNVGNEPDISPTQWQLVASIGGSLSYSGVTSDGFQGIKVAGAISPKYLAYTRYADQYSGATPCDKANAAVADSPSTGAVVDLSGLGYGTLTSCATAGISDSGKPITFKFGYQTWTGTGTYLINLLSNGSAAIGQWVDIFTGTSSATGTTLKYTGAHHAVQIGASTPVSPQSTYIGNFIIDVTGSGAAADGIYYYGGGYAVAENLRFNGFGGTKYGICFSVLGGGACTSGSASNVYSGEYVTFRRIKDDATVPGTGAILRVEGSGTQSLTLLGLDNVHLGGGVTLGSIQTNHVNHILATRITNDNMGPGQRVGFSFYNSRNVEVLNADTECSDDSSSDIPFDLNTVQYFGADGISVACGSGYTLYNNAPSLGGHINGSFVNGPAIYFGTTTFSAASDNQLYIDATGRYSSLYFTNALVKKGNVYYDNTNSKLVVGTSAAGGIIQFNTGNNSSAASLDASGNFTAQGNVVAGAGANVIYYCSAGVSAGTLCRGNGCSCSAGTWTDTGLRTK